MTRPISRPFSRLGLVMAPLVAALGVATALAWQAHQAARSHREVSERVLHDYAEFAGWQFSRAAEQALDEQLSVWLGVVLCPLQSGGGLPSMEALERSGLRARALFAVAPDGGLRLTGRPLDPRAVEALVSAVQPSLERDGHSGRRTVAVLEGDGRPLLVAAQTVWRPAPGTRSAAGFIADLDVIDESIAAVLQSSPLLPPTLARGADAIVGVRVRTPGGAPIFTSAIAGDAVRAGGVLDEKVGALAYDVSLSRAAGGALVIGGLPRSRLPVLAGLLALTAGLLVVSALQLRREYELARLRSDFVSSVSHELRTPLAQIRMFSETLLLGRVRSDREARRSLEIIQQESRRLTHLVENVLYFARGQRRPGRTAPAPIRLGSTIMELVDAFVPLARAAGSEVRVEVRADAVAAVDHGAIRQILLNLLDNAVKYGRPGQTIAVTLDVRGDVAEVAVDDEGAGVPEEARARIWAPYARLAAAGDSAVAGAGIGLAVVRDLTTRHGGTCRVESGSRGGARFVVELPRLSAVPELAHAS